MLILVIYYQTCNNMPTKVFYLLPDQQEPVEVSWRGAWKEISVLFNRKQVGTFANQKELKKGAEFELDDGRKLSVKLRGMLMPELELLIDGIEIPGSPTDPLVKIAEATNIAWLIGGLNLLVGILATLMKVNLLLQMGIGVANVGYGVVILGLSFGVKKKSLISLIVIIALVILDLVSTFIAAADANVNPTTGILIRIFLLVALFRGVAAMRTLQKREKNN